MANKRERNTRGKIISAAWKLFYENGYEDTTVEEIIEESRISKGTFYHYFTGKDALLGTLSALFDERYVLLADRMDPEMNSFSKLLWLNHEMFVFIENEVSMDLLARLYSQQLVTTGEKNLVDHNRYYYKVLRQIVIEGQKKGQISESMTVSEIVKIYAMCERSFIYDWCLSNGEYSLANFSDRMLPVFLSEIRE